MKFSVHGIQKCIYKLYFMLNEFTLVKQTLSNQMQADQRFIMLYLPQGFEYAK